MLKTFLNKQICITLVPTVRLSTTVYYPSFEEEKKKDGTGVYCTVK